MGNIRGSLAYSAAGAASGLAGMLALGRCSGACGSCLGCAAAGLGLVAVVLVHGIRKRGRTAGEGAEDGLA